MPKFVTPIEIVSSAPSSNPPQGGIFLYPDPDTSNLTVKKDDGSVSNLEKTASEISFTPTSTVTSSNVQSALEELDSKKFNTSGGTFTGAVSGTTATFTQVTSTLNGNASSATQAEKDSEGNTISSTYMPKTGGTFTGAISGVSATFTEVKASNGLLKSEKSGILFELGARNEQYVHFYNDSEVPYLFDNHIVLQGNVKPLTDNTSDLGTSLLKWHSVYATNIYGSLSWSYLTNVPEEFNPAPHSHAISDVTGLQNGLDSKADTEHSHTVSDITDFPTLATVATSGSYSDLSNTPVVDSTLSTTSTNAIQNNAVATALNGKADSSHIHSEYLPKTGGTITGSLGVSGSTSLTGLSNDGVCVLGMNQVTAGNTVTIPLTKTLCKIVNPTTVPTTAPTNNIVVSGTPQESQLLIVSNMSDWDAQGSGIYVPSKECQQFIWQTDSEGAGSWISISYGRIILS